MHFSWHEFLQLLIGQSDFDNTLPGDLVNCASDCTATERNYRALPGGCLSAFAQRDIMQGWRRIMTKTILVTADLGHLKAFRLKHDQQPGRPKMVVIQTETTQATRHLSDL